MTRSASRTSNVSVGLNALSGWITVGEPKPDPAPPQQPGADREATARSRPSKADLLAAAFYRAADRLAMATAAALGASTDPEEALSRLSAAYIDLAFTHPEVLPVYFAEIGNLPRHERTNLRNVQRLRSGPTCSRRSGLTLDVGRLIASSRPFAAGTLL